MSKLTKATTWHVRSSIKKLIFPGTVNFIVALIVNVISIFDSHHTLSDSRTITLLIICIITLKFVTTFFVGSLMYGIDFFVLVLH